MKISIIIPFYGTNTRALHQCLDALTKQVGINDSIEVILVDNNLPPLLEELTEFRNVILLQEDKPGSYAARNRGVHYASGDLLAFTDADCIPSSTWLAEGAKALAEENESCAIAGEIYVISHIAKYPSFIENLDAAIHHRQQDYVCRLGFGATANLFVSRETYLKVGDFNERLFSGGDQDWCARLKAIGGATKFRKQVLVHHPARRTFFDLAIKNVRGVGGQFSKLSPDAPRLQSLIKTLAHQFVNRRKFLSHYCRQNGLGLWLGFRLKTILAAIYLLKIGEAFRLCAGGSPVRK